MSKAIGLRWSFGSETTCRLPRSRLAGLDGAAGVAARRDRRLLGAPCCVVTPTNLNGRLQAGLTAGDPDGEVALAWTVAQDLMDLYQLDDPIRPALAAQLITDPRKWPIPEPARVGRTLHAWSRHFHSRE